MSFHWLQLNMTVVLNLWPRGPHEWLGHGPEQVLPARFGPCTVLCTFSSTQGHTIQSARLPTLLKNRQQGSGVTAPLPSYFQIHGEPCGLNDRIPGAGSSPPAEGWVPLGLDNAWSPLSRTSTNKNSIGIYFSIYQPWPWEGQEHLDVIKCFCAFGSFNSWPWMSLRGNRTVSNHKFGCGPRTQHLKVKLYTNPHHLAALHKHYTGLVHDGCSVAQQLDGSQLGHQNNGSMYTVDRETILNKRCSLVAKFGSGAEPSV